MRFRARSAFLAGALLLFAVLAYAPLLSAGLLGEDRAALEAASHPSSGGGTEVIAPLERLSLRASGLPVDLAEGLGLPAAAALRLGNLAWLAVAAFGLARFARRALLPWLGSEPARVAAAWAAALTLLHPLAPPLVASVSARGTLLAGALASLGLAAFLRGRQDRLPGMAALGFLLIGAAGLAGDTARGLAPLVVAAEVFSAHRHRPRRAVLRTTTTTLVVLAAALAVGPLARSFSGGAASLLDVFLGWASLADPPADVAAVIERVVEKLGLLVLPVNPRVVGGAGLLAAGAVFLVAVRPALLAARGAPRLLGGLLITALAALGAGLVLGVPSRVAPDDLRRVRDLLPGVAVASLALACTATAVSGPSRRWTPAVVALGFAVLGHANVRPWPRAARAFAGLVADVHRAVELHGTDASYYVLDPPAPVAGVDPVGELGPAFLGAERARRSEAGISGPRPARLRALSRPAFFLYARQPEFRQERATGPVVIVYRPDPPAAAGGEGARALRTSVRLPAPKPTEGPRSWRGDPTSPALDVDALELTTLWIQVPAGTRLEANDRVGWSAPRSSVSAGTCRGVWLRGGDEPVAVFDLGSSLAWILGGRIRSIRVEGDLLRITEARLAPALPALGEGLAPRTSGDDWVFPVSPLPAGLPEGASPDTILSLLDLDALRLERFRALREGDRLVVPGAARSAARAGGGVAWSLDFCVDGRTIARNLGRIEPRDEP